MKTYSPQPVVFLCASACVSSCTRAHSHTSFFKYHPPTTQHTPTHTCIKHNHFTVCVGREHSRYGYSLCLFVPLFLHMFPRVMPLHFWWVLLWACVVGLVRVQTSGRVRGYVQLRVSTCTCTHEHVCVHWCVQGCAPVKPSSAQQR